MDTSLPSPPAVSALRESFGDRKPPDITRKITACVACRKQKIKCHMREGQAPCSRCKKRGLPCTVNRSLQTLLEEDVTWKAAMIKKIKRLEGAISQIANKVEMPELQAQDQADNPRDSISPPVELNSSEQSQTNIARQEQPESGIQAPPKEHRELPPAWELIMDPRGGPASIPASVVSRGMRSQSSNNLQYSRKSDLISYGLITLRQAHALFEAYHLRLDHFLYRILGDHISLDSVRVASPLLTTAVCTVGALHCPSMGHLFDMCYAEYKALVAAQTFSRSSNEDDVRGLCIGAFWLHEISWTLIGTAVRVASDLNLHSGIYKALKGDRAGYIQARIYYLVYVCDHHFSIAYGRPPMSRGGFIIDSADRLLETAHATEDDARLISQVKEWSLLGQVFDTFGVDVETAIAPESISQLRRYSIALDTWHVDWHESFRENRRVGNYPAKGVGFHYHFAKLYLCSHAFRGMLVVEHTMQCLSPELEEVANVGVLFAMSILRVIVSDAEFRSFMNGLPLYFDTMLAFAVVFLLKVSTKYVAIIRIDASKILSLVTETVAALREMTQDMHKQHLLVIITEGLDRLLNQVSPETSSQGPAHNASLAWDAANFDMSWMENMASFDFQTNFPDVDEWWLHYNAPVTSSGRQVPPN